MKRKLPKLDGELYLGPDGAEERITQVNEYAVWATALDSSAVVRLVRVATHEVPNSKWVEFTVAPEAVLLNGKALYISPEYASLKVRCEWSDFLRLTRWRKNVQGLPSEDQAKIARLTYTNKSTQVMPVHLVAVDHPIRKGGKA